MDSETNEKIKKAHRLDKDVEYRSRFDSVGEMLDFWVSRQPDKNFLTFYDDDGLHKKRELA